MIGDEPIWHDGAVVGWVTSGGYAHNAGNRWRWAMCPTELADTDDGWQVELLGERLPATLQRQPLFDANGSRMRA